LQVCVLLRKQKVSLAEFNAIIAKPHSPARRVGFLNKTEKEVQNV
jgi:hypothetical protein